MHVEEEFMYLFGKVMFNDLDSLSKKMILVEIVHEIGTQLYMILVIISVHEIIEIDT